MRWVGDGHNSAPKLVGEKCASDCLAGIRPIKGSGDMAAFTRGEVSAFESLKF